MVWNIFGSMFIDLNFLEDFFFFVLAVFRRFVSVFTRSNLKFMCLFVVMFFFVFVFVFDVLCGVLVFGFLFLFVVLVFCVLLCGGFECVGGVLVVVVCVFIVCECCVVSDDECDCVFVCFKMCVGLCEKDVWWCGCGWVRLVVARELTRGWLSSFATANVSGDGVFFWIDVYL